MYRFFVSASLLYTKFQVNYNCSNLMYLKKKIDNIFLMFVKCPHVNTLSIVYIKAKQNKRGNAITIHLN